MFLAPALMFLSYLAMRSTGRALPPFHASVVRASGLFAAFFVGGIFEETGWLGYAVDPPQERLGALRASIALGSFWAVSHAVPLVQADRSASLDPLPCLGTVASRVLIVSLYNNAGRSVLAAVLYHTAYN